MRVSILFTVLVIVTTFQTSYADHEHHYVSDGKSGKGGKNSKYKLFKNDKAGKVTHDATSSSASMSMSMSMSMNSESHEHGKTGKEAKYVKGHDYDTKAAKGHHIHHEYYYDYDSKAAKGSSGYYHEHASGHNDDEHDEGVSPGASPSISSTPSLSMRPSHNSHYHYYGKTSKEAKHAKGSYINYKVHDEVTGEWSYDSH